MVWRDHFGYHRLFCPAYHLIFYHKWKAVKSDIGALTLQRRCVTRRFQFHPLLWCSQKIRNHPKCEATAQMSKFKCLAPSSLSSTIIFSVIHNLCDIWDNWSEMTQSEVGHPRIGKLISFVWIFMSVFNDIDPALIKVVGTSWDSF